MSAQEGRVVDRIAGSPISMAQIIWRVEGPDTDPVGRIETDVTGRFHLSPAWSGEGWIEVRSIGHLPRTLSRSEAEATGWLVELEPDPLELESLVVTAAGRTSRSRRSPALSKSFALPIVEWNTRAVLPALPVQVLTQATGSGSSDSLTASSCWRPISG